MHARAHLVCWGGDGCVCVGGEVCVGGGRRRVACVERPLELRALKGRRHTQRVERLILRPPPQHSACLVSLCCSQPLSYISASFPDTTQQRGRRGRRGTYRGRGEAHLRRATHGAPAIVFAAAACASDRIEDRPSALERLRARQPPPPPPPPQSPCERCASVVVVRAEAPQGGAGADSAGCAEGAEGGPLACGVGRGCAGTLGVCCDRAPRAPGEHTRAVPKGHAVGRSSEYA